MKPADWKKRKLNALTRRLVQSQRAGGKALRAEGVNPPQSDAVVEIIQDFFKLFFPGFTGRTQVTRQGLDYYLRSVLDTLFDKLYYQVERALEYERAESDGVKAYAVVVRTFDKLPGIRKLLADDVLAAYEGDPAAKSFEEIVLCYPFIKAIAVHRVAHVLYLLGVPLIPRMMNEWAHKETGIDIHPGATIGKGFFIDHGTGVVIGETAVIGNQVKLYHGVTLGAKSVPKDAHGRAIRGIKRHPTLKDQVTVYSGATILGGETVIGKGAVVGGNTWILTSIKPGAVVTIGDPELIYKNKH